MSLSRIERVLRHDGIVAVLDMTAEQAQSGDCSWVGEERWKPIVLEAVRERRGTDEWKMITANAGNPRGLAPVELYRVDNDPSEQSNLAERDAESVSALPATLERERSRALEGAVDAVIMELTDEDIEQKCRLGYWSAEACCERGFSQYCD